MTTIRAVVFDMGGVLTHAPLDGMHDHARALGLPEDAFSQYFRGHPLMERLETAEISIREFFKAVCHEVEEVHGHRVDLRALVVAVERGQELIPSRFDLVRAARRTCWTALLTNNVREATWRETFPFDLFDEVVDSSEVGVRKPDPRIYRELLDRLDLPADQVVFIDDYEENLPPAQQLGIRTIHFVGPDDCRARLGELGIPTNAPQEPTTRATP